MTGEWLHKRVDWSRHPMGPVDLWPKTLLHLLATIEQARQPMLVTWGPERFMFYNSAYRPILAGKPSAIGLRLEDVFSESWHASGPVFAKAELGESVYLQDFEAPLTRNGRTERSWWTLSCSPIPLGPDGIGGVLCIVHETTRARLAEMREREGQEELARLTDLVPSLLWKADSYGRPVWRNDRLKALSKAANVHARGLWRTLIHPEDLTSVLAELAAAKKERRPFAKTFRLKVSPDTYRWHQARSEPVSSDDGRLVWYGVATDIHEARDALDTLKRREALFTQFTANSANLLWTVDLETLVIERLSPNFGSVWPTVTPDTKWLWPEFLASIHEMDRSAVEAGFDRAAGGGVVHGRFRIVSKDGQIRSLDGTTFPIVDPDGRIPLLGGILRDVTPHACHLVHLIDKEPASQNRLSHALRKLGFDVKTFDSVTVFAQVAAAIKPGPVLLRHGGNFEDLCRLSGLIRSALTGRPWLVIQDSDQPARDAVAIMKMGACDVVDHDAPMEAIAVALHTAATLVRTRATSQENDNPVVYRLTTREQQILEGIVSGGTNKSIARTLGLSPRTVETHRRHVMEKLEVNSLAELVSLATSKSFRSTSAN